MDLSKLVEEVMDLSTKQPDGVIHDADTILADIMGAADFHISGISDDILKLYLEVENKDDFEALFYLMADEKFEDYLIESKKVMKKNVSKAEPRVVQVYLLDSDNDEKGSIIFETDAPKTVIENWIKTQHNSISSNYPFHHMVMGLLDEGYMVKLLYDQYSSKCNDVKLIDQYSCEEVYHVGYSIENILHHVSAFISLYRNASGVPYIKLTDTMDESDLRKIAHELGIRFIKGHQFCFPKKKAHLCDLNTSDVERIARQERYVFLPLDKEDPRIQELQEAGNLIKMKDDLFMVSFHDFRLLEACGWLKDHVDIHLENLLESGEKIQKYVFAEDPCLTFGCIIDEDAEFTADALEDTLHRLIDEGASRYKIYELTRMIHEDGNEALINQDDAIPVDLGYYITGNITLI